MRMRVLLRCRQVRQAIKFDKHIRHLPVLCDKQLRGIVSIGDVVKYLIIEKDFKIKNLQTYISGVM